MTSPHSPIRLIAISGASGSGKSTIAQQLYAEWGNAQASLISTDNYYHDLSHLPPDIRARQNFDHPNAIDRKRLTSDLNQLIQGNPVTIPHYNFNTHTRSPETTWIEPTPYIILEGLFALSYPELNSLITLSVFIQIPEDIALQRRIQRDCHERGRTEAEVIAQFQTTVLPSFQQHIAPIIPSADLLLSGTEDPHVNVSIIRKHLQHD